MRIQKDEAVARTKRSNRCFKLYVDQLKEANKDGYVDVVQLEYNLLHRENEEVMKYAAENDITFVPYFPLASGILAGGMKKIKLSTSCNSS